MKCPCSPMCTKRNSNCHAKCQEYLKYEKEKHKEYLEKQKERDLEAFCYENIIRKSRILHKH